MGVDRRRSRIRRSALETGVERPFELHSASLESFRSAVVRSGMLAGRFGFAFPEPSRAEP